MSFLLLAGYTRYFESIICSGMNQDNLLAIIRDLKFDMIIAVNKHSSCETGEMNEIVGRMQNHRLLYSKVS